MIGAPTSRSWGSGHEPSRRGAQRGSAALANDGAGDVGIILETCHVQSVRQRVSQPDGPEDRWADTGGDPHQPAVTTLIAEHT